jgi:predicted RNA-binding protein
MYGLHAYLVREGREELIIENVETIEPAGKELEVRDIHGQRYRLTARIQAIDLITQKVLLKENFTGATCP